jgi:aminopeptidase N
MMIRFPIATTALLLSTTLLAGSSAAPGRLPLGVTPQHYDITVKPNAEKMVFSGSETIDVKIAAPTQTITLNAADLEISKAGVDGVPAKTIALDNKAQTVTLTFDAPVSAGDHKLFFDFSGKINTSAAGFFALDYKTVNGKDARMLATQFEAPDARRFAPMWDEPAYKATFRLNTVAPDGQSAYSNMPIERTEKLDGGTAYHFATSPKMSSYLLFLGMGDVERKTTKIGDVEIGIITRRGVVDQGDYALESAANIVKNYNDYFGTPYPLPKLDMIAAPGSSQFFGAMENWGAILYFERRVLIDPALATESQRQDVYITVAHEIAHQWFGNLVTMAWWEDLWLNEGFASWMESKVTNALNPGWQIRAQTVGGGRQGAMNLDARATTHPIVQKIETVDQISQAFDTITYQKGEAVIRMLEATIGEDAFRAGVQSYMKKYAYSNTVTTQLWDELEASSGKPVAAIMRGFTTQDGVPLIKVGTPTCVGGKTSMTLSQSRFALDAGSKRPQTWTVPVNVGLAGKGAEATQQLMVSGAKPVTVKLPGCGIPIVNFGQEGYYRTLYSPTHFAVLKDKFARLALEDQIGLIADSLASANGDYTPIGQHLSLLSAVPQSASPLVWRLIAGQLSALDDRVKGTPNQAAYRRKAGALLTPAFAKVGWTAKPGEEPDVAQLREVLLPVMALFGDAGVVKDAKRYVELSFADPAAVPSAVRLTALSVFGRNADLAGWNMLHQKAKDEKNPVTQNIYYRALASTANPVLAAKALAIALTNEAPVPIRSSIIANVSGEHPDMAFDWAVMHKAEVNAILEESSKSEFIVGLADGGSNLALANRVTAYANANLPAQSRAPARQAVGLITYRAGRKAVQGSGIGIWARSK